MFEQANEQKDREPGIRSDEQKEGDASQFLTFRMAGEKYGVDILAVREIIGCKDLTTLPAMADYIKGVINLRGDAVPVIDLRARFGIAVKPYDKFTVVIILEVQDRILGAVVDAVSDVVVLEKEAIQPPPSFHASIRTDFLQGMAQENDRFTILLNVERLFSREELHELDQAV